MSTDIQSIHAITQRKIYISFLAILCMVFSTLAQEGPVVRSDLDTTNIRIGEQMKFTITVEADTTAQVFFPEGQTFSPLETVEAFKTDTTRKNDRMVLQKIYALTQFDSGRYVLPIQQLDIDGSPYFTDSVAITVATVPVDTLKQKMYDIKPLMQVDRNLKRFWIIAIIAFVLLVIGALAYWFLWRKKPLTEEEKEAQLPPYDRALIELDRLEQSKYLIQDEFKKYYSELTKIVRSYLEEEVQVTALESTTSELLEKLELMRDSGSLLISEETLGQFEKVLKTADLVKFARSKPAIATAETDRKMIREVVVKTKEAIPEPTEEELMQTQEYLEELQRQRRRKRVVRIALGSVVVLFLLTAGLTAYFGPRNVWENVAGNPTKELLQGEWIESVYGFPPITLETPEVLIREEPVLPEQFRDSIRMVQAFRYLSDDALLSVSAMSVTMKNASREADFEALTETALKRLEAEGARNIITKREPFTSGNGVVGVKVYGSARFPVPDGKDSVKGQYAIILFGGMGFQQQVVLAWQDGDQYAEQIVERILQNLEIDTQV